MPFAKVALFWLGAVILSFFAPVRGLGKDRIRIGVPLFPTVAFPAFVANDKRIFEKIGLSG